MRNCYFPADSGHLHSTQTAENTPKHGAKNGKNNRQNYHRGNCCDCRFDHEYYHRTKRHFDIDYRNFAYEGFGRTENSIRSIRLQLTSASTKEKDIVGAADYDQPVIGLGAPFS